MPINTAMTPPSFPAGTNEMNELIDHSVTRLTVLLGALKTIQDHEPLLGPRVREAILHSAIAHGLELQSLIDRVRAEAAAAS
ncbi:MAG TPA: hypothetical protein VIG64_07845 [Actinomycetota bacterium]|jgi:hypothetical protein